MCSGNLLLCGKVKRNVVPMSLSYKQTWKIEKLNQKKYQAERQKISFYILGVHANSAQAVLGEGVRLIRSIHLEFFPYVSLRA